MHQSLPRCLMGPLSGGAGFRHDMSGELRFCYHNLRGWVLKTS